jgi:hypothetical protein
MAQVSFQVASYNFYHWSSRNGGSSKTNLNLRGVSGENVGVWFIQEENTALPQAVQHSAASFSLYYHRSQFEHIVDMLRNEKPIWVHFDNNNGWNNSRISTTDEPVGEGEQSV